MLRTYLDGDHYVLITGIDDTYCYIWDPYYLDENYYDEDKCVILEFNEPFKYNRKVSINRVVSHMKKDFALGPLEKRECALFYRKDIK